MEKGGNRKLGLREEREGMEKEELPGETREGEGNRVRVCISIGSVT